MTDKEERCKKLAWRVKKNAALMEKEDAGEQARKMFKHNAYKSDIKKK